MNIKRTAMIALAVTVPFSAAGYFAAAAHADPISELAFIKVLDGEGIGYSSATEAVKAGRVVCELRGEGNSQAATIAAVFVNTGLMEGPSAYFVGAAEAAFCPGMFSPLPDNSASAV